MAQEVENTVEQTDQEIVIPEDYAAFEKWRETGEVPAEQETPTAGEETPSSESSEENTEDGQIAAESDPEGEAEQVQKELDEEGNQEPERKENRLARRMRKLAGTIAELQSRLDTYERGEAGDEGTEEVASSPESEAEQEELARPMLRDFEDDPEEGGKSAWDKYEEATAAYNEKLTAKRIADALERQRAELEEKHARESAQAEWDKAASRFPDYNEVVRDEVKISAAMEAVMRMDPVAGTELAYYLGQHPEESERIAKQTLAANEKQWTSALARAGMLLGEIRSKLAPPGKKAEAAPAAAAPTRQTPSAPAPKPQKQVSTASRPPATIRGRNVPQPDPTNDEDARDYAKWEKAREAQLRKR